MAGGAGLRLSPLTIAVSKQLLPLYNKPIIHYPIATLLAAGIREILLIATPSHQSSFERLLGNGSSLGIEIRYAVQPEPKGIAEAFIIGEDFIGSSDVSLILGDNFFHGVGLGRHLGKYTAVYGAQIFTYEVSNPEEYGVLVLNDDGTPLSIIEKPSDHISNLAITGLYFYDNSVIDISKNIKPSIRGELEISSVNEVYLRQNLLSFSPLPRGTLWMDTGSFEGLHDAGTYVRIVEERQGSQIGCLEEICWRQGWLSDSDLEHLALRSPSIQKKSYLQKLLAI